MLWLCKYQRDFAGVSTSQLAAGIVAKTAAKYMIELSVVPCMQQDAQQQQEQQQLNGLDVLYSWDDDCAGCELRAHFLSIHETNLNPGLPLDV